MRMRHFSAANEKNSLSRQLPGIRDLLGAREHLAHTSMIVAALAALPFTIGYVVLGIWVMALIHAAFLILIMTGLLLVESGRGRGGRLLALFGSIALLFCGSVISGTSSRFELFLLLTAVASPFFIPWERRKLTRLGISASLAAFALAQLLKELLPPLVRVPEPMRSLAAHSVTALSALIIGAMLMGLARSLVAQQQDLANANLHLELAQAVTASGSWEGDVAADRYVCSRGLLALFGLEAPAAGKVAIMPLARFESRLQGTGQGQLRAALQRAAAGERAIQIRLCTTAGPEGQRREIDALVTPLTDKHPGPVIGVAEDVTEADRMARQLAERTAFIAQIADSVPLVLYVMRLDDLRCIYVNGMAERLLGLSPASILALPSLKSLRELVHPADRAATRSVWESMPGLADAAILESKFRLRARNGSWLTCAHRASVFRRDASGKPTEILSSLQDVSAQEEAMLTLEVERARSAQNIHRAAFGEMAGGIAHEINNPLAIIRGRASQLADLIATRPHDHDNACRYAEKILSTTARLESIVAGMRELGHDAALPDAVATASVEAVLKEAIERCDARLASLGITLRHTPFAEIPDAPCHRDFTLQALLNLIGNAADAARGSGAREVEIRVTDASQAIHIDVLDSGEGIPEELERRIFEPFFSTKRGERRIGLGLSLARSVVERQGGSLNVVSGGDRTCFRILLPRRDLA